MAPARSKSPAPRRTPAAAKKRKSPTPRKKQPTSTAKKSGKKKSAASYPLPFVHAADNPHPELVVPAKGAHNLDIITGDHGIPMDVDLHDFIWTSTDEPHASRRKALIRAHPELTKLMGHEWKLKWYMLGLMAIQLYLAYFFREEALWGATPRFYLTAYVVGATVTQALFLGNHEVSHNLAFRKFSHNRLFGIFANIPMVLPYFVAFKHYHNEHHKMQVRCCDSGSTPNRDQHGPSRNKPLPTPYTRIHARRAPLAWTLTCRPRSRPSCCLPCRESGSSCSTRPGSTRSAHCLCARSP